MLGVQTQFIIRSRQMLYQLSHLPSPSTVLFSLVTKSTRSAVRSCISYLSIAVTKPSNQSNLQKKSLFGLMVPAGEEPVMAGILPTSSRHGGRSRTLRAHILNHKDKTEPMPGDILLSTKPHLLTLPNSIINWGSLWGTFKLPQTQTRRSWWSGVAGDTDLRFSLLLRLPFPRNLYHLANVYREGL